MVNIRGVLGARALARFAAGLAVLAAALLSLIDTIGGQLFSMHMVQHLLLMLVAAPLLVAGALPLAALWALPRRALVVRWHGVAAATRGRNLRDLCDRLPVLARAGTVTRRTRSGIAFTQRRDHPVRSSDTASRVKVLVV